MTAEPTTIPISPKIQSRLDALRWRIRAYIWLEGLALIVIWVGLMFWISYALDYLPVLLGFYLPSVLGLDEMTRPERIGLLMVVGAVGLWIFYRWILRRAFVPLADHSMAVLLERQFRDDHDSLVTTVEMAELPSHATDFSSDMLDHTSEVAASRLDEVRMARAFNHFPLWRNLIGAAIVLASLLLFVALSTQTFATVTRRLYGLVDERYARRAEIEMVCVEVEHTRWLKSDEPSDEEAESQGEEGTVVRYVKDRRPTEKPFENGVVRVARGASPRLIVRARKGPNAPDYCKVRFWTDEGYTEWVPMQKITKEKDPEDEQDDSDEFQYFVHRDRPLKGIRSDVQVEAMGGDNRVRGYSIEVVDGPTVIGAQLNCNRPEYTGLVPQKIDFAPGVRLAEGTRIAIEAATNKPLARVHIYDPDAATMAVLTGEQLSGSGFRHVVEQLDDDLGLEITLEDADGITSDEPYRMAIGSVEDMPPSVKVRLRGISSVITPDARLPGTGIISDDYGLAEACFEIDLVDDDPIPYRFPIEVRKDGSVDAAVDLRDARTRERDPIEFKPGNKLVLSAAATDKCDLGGGPNVGRSELYQLTVITPDELLIRLDAREIAQRQRFEQIMDELMKTRGDLVRVQGDLERGGQSTAGAEPEDSIAPKESENGADAEPEDSTTGGDSAGAEPGDEPVDEDVQRSLRQTRVEWAIRQTEKSSQEMAGVAATFDDIREELINNRVDTEDRQERLKKDISEPIKEIAGPMCDELARRLETLKQQIDEPTGRQAAADATEQIDLVLLEMAEVLKRMLDIETFTEVIEIFRELIKEQEDVIDATKKANLDIVKGLLQ